MTKKLALPLLFVATLLLSLLPTMTASASGESYAYQYGADTILGSGGSYNNTDYLFKSVTSGTSTAKQVIGTLTFTKDSSGNYVSSQVQTSWQSGTTTTTCQMTLSISLSGSTGSLSAKPSNNVDAGTCLSHAALTTTISIPNVINDQGTCDRAGGNWSQGAGSRWVCTGVNDAGASCALAGNTYSQGAGSQFVCTGDASQTDLASQYTTEASCTTAGYEWSDPDGDGVKTCNVIGTTSSGTEKVTCESTGNPLAFFLCPIFNGMGDFTDWMLNKVIVPMLDSQPIGTSQNNADGSPNVIYRVWSSFRIYANVILVIILLIIVFGQVIGGGVMDAYSVRKALPRVLAAAILINLSIYIVAIMVDVTNVLGKGIGQLMMAPLNNTQITLPGGDAGTAAQITLNGGQSAVATLGLLATSAGGAAALVLGVLGGWSIISSAMVWVGLFVLLPLFLGILMAFVTILLRSAIITALIFIAPVAFALWCLPNTEKYFKKWWDLLLNMLMAYPIIVAIFAVCSIMSVTLNSNGSPIASILAFVMTFLPLFLIPFAFKLAGGAIGTLSGFLMNQGKRGAETVKGNANDPTSLRNHARYRMRSSFNMARGRGYDISGNANKRYGAAAGDETASGRARARARLMRGLTGASQAIFGAGNLQAERAQMNAERDKIVSDQYSNGADSNIRAFWAVKGEDGQWHDYYDKEKTWSDGDVQAAKRIVGRDPSMVQSYAKYEFGKAANDTQALAFKDRFRNMANDYHWSADDANGIWSGVKFAYQGSRLEQKHSSGLAGDKGGLGWAVRNTGANVRYGDVNQSTYSEELADRVRAWDLSSLRSSSPEAALEGYLGAVNGTLTDGKGNAISEEKRQEIIKNYRNVSDRMRERQRQGYSVWGNQEEGEQTTTGAGVGGSARAEVAWQKFMDTVSGPVRSPGQSPGNNPNQMPPSGRGPAPTTGSPSGGNGGPSPSSTGGSSSSRRATREQGAPTTWEQVILHTPSSTSAPTITGPSSPGPRRSTREQGPSTAPTTGGSASLGQTSSPAGAISPDGSRRVIRPQGAPENTGGTTPTPPSTVIRPTSPINPSGTGPVDLPPSFNPINPPQTPPGAGPSDLPEWMRNNGDNPPPDSQQ